MADPFPPNMLNAENAYLFDYIAESEYDDWLSAIPDLAPSAPGDYLTKEEIARVLDNELMCALFECYRVCYGVGEDAVTVETLQNFAGDFLETARHVEAVEAGEIPQLSAVYIQVASPEGSLTLPAPCPVSFLVEQFQREGRTDEAQKLQNISPQEVTKIRKGLVLWGTHEPPTLVVTFEEQEIKANAELFQGFADEQKVSFLQIDGLIMLLPEMGASPNAQLLSLLCPDRFGQLQKTRSPSGRFRNHLKVVLPHEARKALFLTWLKGRAHSDRGKNTDFVQYLS
ncbi:hypothetical protein ACFYPT_36055 [Streptomyces sp. NPDC005529]|uniref:hypothetical protein n=1 Tax=unclassified Streptomyces TaxID=2593676 RepID=UPI0033A51ADC